MLLNYGITIFLILFIEGLGANSLKEDVAFFFKQDGEGSHDRRIAQQFQDGMFKVIESATESVQKLFKNYSFSSATVDDMIYLYPTVFFHVPSEKLAKVSSSELAKFLDRINDDVYVVTKILRTLKNDKKLVDFVSRLNGDNLNLEIIRTIAEDLIQVSTNDENALDLLLQNRWLLLEAPPSFLFNLKNVHNTLLFFYIHYIGPALDANKFWNHRLIRRTWSKLIIESNNVFLRSKEEYIFDNFRRIMEGMNLVEMEKFLTSNSENLQLLQSIDWNTVQIRNILDHLYSFNVSLAEKFQISFLPHLLPRQIQQIRRDQLQNALSNVSIPDDLSLPVAMQLFEYMLITKGDTLKFSSIITDLNSELVSKLLFSQSITSLSKLSAPSLSMNLIAKLDSPKYSFLQAHYILNYDELYSNEDNLLTIKELLGAIPASFFINFEKIFKNSNKVYLNHALQYSPPGNRIKALALLELYFASGYDYADIFEHALLNKNNEFISLISPLDISTNANKIMEIIENNRKSDTYFETRAATLPNYILTELLRKSENITYEKLFDDSYPLRTVIMGLNCDILSKIYSGDFLPIFNFYNQQRIRFHKKFPKDLQHCAKEAYLSYLRDKFVTFTEGCDENLIDFMELEDIRSIGGYVLTALPLNVALKSKYSDGILQEIGRLSLPELMLAASKNHLVSLTSKYLENKVADKVIELEYLLRLGNLIHFLEERHLRKIDAAALRFILEAETIDTRICASSVVREIWQSKLIEAFGYLEKWDEDALLKVGDMLVVISNFSLSSIRSDVRLNIADLMKSNYAEEIEWIPRYTPFYDVCRFTFSSQEERTSYELAVTHLSEFYAVSIENQLLSVLRANYIAEIVAEQSTEFTEVISDSGTTTVEITSAIPTKNQLKSTLNYHDFNSNLNGARDAEIDEISNEQQSKGNLAADFLNSIFGDFRKPVSDSETFNNSPTLQTTTSDTSMNTNGNLLGKTEISLALSQPSESNALPYTKDSQSSSTVSVKLNDTLRDLTISSSTMQTVVSASPSTTPAKISVDTTPSTGSSTMLQFDTVPEHTKNPTYFREETTDVKLLTSERNTFEINYKMSNSSVTIPSVAASDLTTSVLISNAEASLMSTFVSTQPAFIKHELGTLSIPSQLSSYSTTSASLQNVEDGKSTQSSFNKVEQVQSKFANSLNTTVSPEYISSINPYQDTLFTTSVELLNLTNEFSNNASFIADGENSNISFASAYRTSYFNSSTKKETRSVQFNNNDMKTSISNEMNAEDNASLSSEYLKRLIQQVMQKKPTRNLNSRRKRGLNVNFYNNIEISCNTLKILGSMSQYVIPSLNLTEDDYFDCIELFGQLNLDEEMKNKIWHKVKSNKIFNSNLIFVAGKLLSVIEEEDYRHINFSLNSEWALELVNSLSENMFDSRTIITNFLRGNEHFNAEKTLPSTAVVALGKLMCGLPENTLRKILRESREFSGIWLAFHSLNHCPKKCLKIIAEEAVKKFGQPQHWKPSVFTMLGPAAAGLFEMDVEFNFTRHLHTSAIECISFENINKLLEGKQNENISHTLLIYLKERRNHLCSENKLCSTTATSSSTETITRKDSHRSKEKISEHEASSHSSLKASLFLLAFLNVRFLL